MRVLGTSGTACGRCSRSWLSSPSSAPACCERALVRGPGDVRDDLGRVRPDYPAPPGVRDAESTPTIVPSGRICTFVALGLIWMFAPVPDEAKDPSGEKMP